MSHNAEENVLAELGYKQALHRGIGSFGSFAAGISYISILTGVFQLFYFGYGSAGPAYLWSWPMVFIGQGLVALCFMELAARYSVAGSVYNWTKILGNHILGWCGGWLMLTASVITIASVVIALQANLPRLWKGFQIVGDPQNPRDQDAAYNALILGIVAIIITTLINSFSVKFMNLCTSIGVVIELVAAVSLVIILLCHIRRGPEVFFHTKGFTEPGKFLPAFLVGSIASGYVMYGYDTASSLAEETFNPRTTAPRSIAKAITASFVIGGGILFCAVMAVADLHDPLLSQNGGLQHLVQSTVGPWLSIPIQICIILAVIVCALTVHTAAIRLSFAMARDNNLPFAPLFSGSFSRFGTPIISAVIIGCFAAIFLLINANQSHIFSAITSIAVVLVYLSYLLVTGTMLYRRLHKKWPDERHGQYFTLGKYGLVINILAVLWGLMMVVNMAWPRKGVYGNPWYYTWSGILWPMLILGLGLLWLALRGKSKSSILDDHRVEFRSK